MRSAKKIFIATFVALALLAPVLANAAPAIKTIESQALLDMIANNKGKIVIVNFFATWCPPCREEIPELVRFYKKADKNKVVVLGLSIDEDIAPVSSFLQQLGVKYPVYKSAMDIVGMYGVRGIPHNVIYAPSGKMIVNMPGVAMEEDLQEFVKLVWEAESNQ